MREGSCGKKIKRMDDEDIVPERESYEPMTALPSNLISR